MCARGHTVLHAAPYAALILEAVEGELCLLEVPEMMRCVQLCLPEESEVLAVPEVMRCVLLCILEVLELMRCVLSVCWRSWRVGFVCWRS